MATPESLDPVELRDGDQRGRSAPDPVESRWGMAVICTLWAATAPITDPTTTPTPISTVLKASSMFATKMVATSAITMPTAAMVFPERAVSGRLSRRMPKMKSAAATR